MSRALAWVDQMRVPGSACHYRLHSQAEPTIFASCFALFFLHLCRRTKEWTADVKSAWIDYLLSFQEKDTGLFRDPDSNSRVTDLFHDKEHLDWQLTGFCLAALRALGAEPRFPIRYVAPWFSAQHMHAWLDALDWKRSSNSGNKAMFIAIMLLDEMERGNQRSKEGLRAWLDWHNHHADPHTGYWGSARDSRYFHGMAGFVHQFLIYNYNGYRAPYPQSVVDRTLLLQQPDGLFSPALGGAACDDLDAIHALCYLYHTENYRRKDILEALQKALRAILSNQNPDGGFSWGKRHRFSLKEWLTLAIHNTHPKHPYLLYLSLRTAFSGQRHLNTRQKTGWSSQSWGWSQSSLWDTWFRTLAIAEIETVLDPSAARTKWQVLRAPNFGWFLLPQP